MPETKLDLGDAAELSEMLTFLAEWLSGSQNACSKAASPPSSATLHTASMPS